LEIVYNGQTRQIADGATVAALLGELELPARYVAVEVNQQVVPRGQHAEHQLRPGDRLEVVTLVGGG